ncbi:MAG: CRISPR-associated endonuclease Cas2 [Thiomonas sp.]|jgi:CRISPR-associated protein Cas2
MSTASPQDTEQLHLIAFDLASDRRRYRLTRLLEGYGQRVQESVFECWISGEQRATLLRKAAAIVHPAQDRLVCYALTADESARCRTYGCAQPILNPDYHLI